MELFFKKRPGCTNNGIEYEHWNIAGIVLNLVSDKRIKNFYISSNNEEFGAFDDIVVEIELETGCEVYALQLKHKDKRNLALESLKSKKGDFSISKYFDSYRNIKNAVSTNVILFTNLKFDIRENTQIQLDGEEFWIEVLKCDQSKVFTLLGKSGYCYKFRVVEDSNHKESAKLQDYKTFFKHFFLYVGQDNLKNLKINLGEAFETQYPGGGTAFDKYIKFITEWSMQEGKKQKLEKIWMQRVIALQLLSPRIKPFDFNSDNEKMIILREAISAFDVTIFDNESYDRVKRFWGNVEDGLVTVEELNRITRQYYLDTKYISTLKDIDGILLAKLLWLNGKCPLIVVQDTTVLKTIEMCSTEKFVVLGKKPTTAWPEKKLVFQKLSDLKTNPEIYNKLLKSLTCKIQEKKEFPLEHLAEKYNKFVESIKTDHLLVMVEGSINIGGEKELLPDPYIQRFLLKKIIDIKYLEKISGDVLIIIFCVTTSKNLRNKFNQHNFIDIDNYLQDDSNTENASSGVAGSSRAHSDLHSPERNLKRINVYVCKSDYKKKYFDKLSHKIQWTNNCHQFRLRSDGNLEWIRSKGHISELQQFQLTKYDHIEEQVIWNSKPANNINLVISDPGMGKTELLKNFKNNCFVDVWTVIVNSKDINLFCQNLNKETHHGNAFKQFILKEKYKDLSVFDKELLKLSFEEERGILVWDALDEIAPEYLESATNMITYFSEKTLLQIVTSRCHLQTFLETKFNVMSWSLNYLSQEEQQRFFEERLRDGCSDGQIIEITNRIKTTFAIIEHKDILGIPLQIFMVTELFRQDVNKYLDLLNSSFSLTDLYYHFVEEKFNIYFIKNNMFHDRRNPQAQLVVKPFKAERIKWFQYLALYTLLSPEVLNQLGIHFEIESQEIVQDLVGLVIEEAHQIRFLHNSFAEYFVALYFSENLEWKHVFVNVIFDQRYTNIRFFFDLMLAKNSTPHKAVLYKDYDLLKQYGDKLHAYKDEGGRNVLHVVCSWGRSYPRLKLEKNGRGYIVDDGNEIFVQEGTEYLEMIDYLLQSCQPLKNDVLFCINTLEYAQKCNCFAAMLKIIQKLRKDILEICDESEAINILYYSARFGFDEVVECFLARDLPVVLRKNDGSSLLHLATSHSSYMSKLLNTSSYRKQIDIQNNNGQTPLHIASEMGNHECVEYLISSGANINLPDDDGSTPLFLASKRGHQQVFDLLTKAAADANFVNKNGFTPLHAASENGREEIVEFLTTSGADVNFANHYGFTALHGASYNDHKKIVEILLDNGAKVNLADVDGFTPLHAASMFGHEEIVETLTISGAEINLADVLGQSPLHNASWKGFDKIVRFLIKSGAKVNLDDRDGFTPLHLASRNGHEKVVECLVESGAKVDFVSRDGFTSLHVASQNGHQSVVRVLIAFSAKVNLVDKNGFTPLHVASEKGNHECVDYLISSGAKVNAPDNEGSTPIFLASKRGHNKVLESLIKAGADANFANKNGFTPVHIASKNGHGKIVEDLTRSGVNVNFPSHDGFTPLHSASYNGHKKIVEVLVLNDAKVNLTDSVGFTSLHAASQNGHEKIAQFLIKSGAEVNLANKDGLTPLHVAAKIGHENVVEVLTRSGAEVNLVDKNGFTPLYLALQKRHGKVVEILVSSGAKINLANKNGSTPLHTAAQNGHEKVVEFLTASGVKVDLSDKNGFTPLYLASQNGHEKIVRILVTFGAKVDLESKNGSTPLHIASQNGHLNVVKYLTELGAKVNLANKDGFTSLHLALQNDHEKVINFLVAVGAKVDFVLKNGLTPLHTASRKGLQNVVQILTASGAEVNLADKDGFTPLHLASRNSHEKVVKFLVAVGAKVDLASKDGLTPLYIASRKGHQNLVEILIAFGADVNLADNDGFTPLYVASQNGHETVAEILVASGAKVDLASKGGFTPLHIASRNGHQEVVRFLIASGADANFSSNHGMTSLHFASSWGQEKVIAFLLGSGAKINTADSDGFTPLHTAAQNGHRKVVEVLVAFGANAKLLDKDGFTPLLVAFLNGRQRIVEFLSALPDATLNENQNNNAPRNKIRRNACMLVSFLILILFLPVAVLTSLALQQ